MVNYLINRLGNTAEFNKINRGVERFNINHLCHMYYFKSILQDQQEKIRLGILYKNLFYLDLGSIVKLNHTEK